MTFPKTGGAEWAAAQASPHVPVNASLRRLDALASRAIIVDRDLATPPGSCSDGANYLVAASPTGAWAGQAGKMATAVGTNAVNGWTFQTIAVEGYQLYVQDENATIQNDGAAWVILSIGSAPTRPVAGFFTSIPTADETLLLYAAVEAITFAANFTGSRGKIGINPTASYVLTVYKNPTFTGLLITGGTVIGTITISTGGVFTFATTGGLSQSLAAGDLLGVKAPTTPDTTAASAAFSLLGSL